MSEPTATATKQFTITRVFDAPRDVVWRCWTDPDEAPYWLHPRGIDTPRDSVDFDLRPGGRYRYTMVAGDGTTYPTVGTYREVDPPRRLVFTWGSPGDADDEMPLPRELRRVAERHLGPIADARYGYGDAGTLEQLLRGAGFADVQVRARSRTARLDDGGQAFVRLNAAALLGVSAAGKTMGPDERQRTLEKIVGDSAPVLSAYAAGGSLAVETRSNLATARG